MSGLPRCSMIADNSHATLARDRGIRDRAEVFLGYIVDDVEVAEPAAVGELVVKEIGGPARVRLRFNQDRHSVPTAFRRAGLLRPVNPLRDKADNAVDARGFALPPQQVEQTSVAEAPLLVRQLSQPGAKLRI